MYEVELKVELSEEKKNVFLETCAERGYVHTKTTPQHDVYIEAVKSPHGGYDLKRYRHEGDEYIYTEKIWEMHDGKPIRKEIERTVIQEEFEQKVAEFPNAIAFNKDRMWFDAIHDGRDISLTLDSVKFSHSPAMRYFTEAEIPVEEKEGVAETKEFIRQFYMELLGLPGIEEMPGMFTMAFEKK